MLQKSIDRVSYLALIRACWRLAGGHRGKMAAVYALLFGANAINLLQPLLLGKVVDVVSAGGPHVISNLALWLGAIMLATTGFWAFHGPARVMERKFAFTLRARLTSRLYNQVAGLPWAWHQKHHSGDTLNRLNFAVEAIYMFADEQFGYLDVMFSLVGSVAMLLWVAPKIGLLVMVTLPIMLLIIARFDKALALLNTLQNKAEHHLSAGLFDYLGNISTVLTLRLQGVSRREVERRMNAIVEPRNRMVVVTEQKWFFINFFLQIMIGVCLMAYALIERNSPRGLEAGAFVVIFRYLQQITGSVGGFGGRYQSLLRYQVNLAGLDEIEAAHRQHGVPANESGPTGWTEARIENIGFRYEDQHDAARQFGEMSLDLRRGKRIALVGGSGSGKSTLLRLLRGLHKPETGTLFLDGEPAGFAMLDEFSTLVPQDAEIFENTVRYNVTCGVVDEAAALDCAVRLACLDSVVETLPNRLDTTINERGMNLSGGQKQRLALARGLFAARNSSLILLDEPTSSLDPATELEVYRRMFAERVDACIVSSIHRLHLLEHFDHIYVLDQGRVVEEGTLDELLAGQGDFSRLWDAQMKSGKVA